MTKRNSELEKLYPTPDSISQAIDTKKKLFEEKKKELKELEEEIWALSSFFYPGEKIEFVPEAMKLASHYGEILQRFPDGTYEVRATSFDKKFVVPGERIVRARG